MGFYAERIFPYLCAKATSGFDQERQEVTGWATGRVLELGIGTGANFEYYPPTVDEVIGLEPSLSMIEKSQAKLDALGHAPSPSTKFRLVQGSATSIQFENHTFDTVVAFFAFCSFDQPDRAAQEAYRVLKPGGRLVFFEHVQASETDLRKWQERWNGVWKRVACGCHLTRNTRALFEQAGFEFNTIRTYRHPNSMKLTSPKIQGIAIRPYPDQPQDAKGTPNANQPTGT